MDAYEFWSKIGADLEAQGACAENPSFFLHILNEKGWDAEVAETAASCGSAFFLAMLQAAASTDMEAAMELGVEGLEAALSSGTQGSPIEIAAGVLSLAQKADNYAGGSLGRIVRMAAANPDLLGLLAERSLEISIEPSNHGPARSGGAGSQFIFNPSGHGGVELPPKEWFDAKPSLAEYAIAFGGKPDPEDPSSDYSEELGALARAACGSASARTLNRAEILRSCAIDWAALAANPEPQARQAFFESLALRMEIASDSNPKASKAPLRA